MSEFTYCGSTPMLWGTLALWEYSRNAGVVPHSGIPSNLWEYSHTMGVVSQCECIATLKKHTHNV
jgi:hypothetical protein